MGYHTGEPWNPTIRQIVDESHSLSRRKGWYDDHRDNLERVPEKLMLVVSELSEALEEFRTNGPFKTGLNDIRYDGNGKPIGFATEVADAFIRLADLSGWLGIDIGRAIMLKHAYNETRQHRHGGKAC